MNEIVIFTGPTISALEAAKVLPATFLPPVAQGDVYRVSRQRPKAIGIIDGYFQSVPAVWHKEILWALARGIHVFGSASMGALRAAELQPFGMEGVGEIFSDLRSGALEDDDDVAVAHGDASTGYRTTSEAMVNVRATCRAAVAEGVISPATSERLQAIGKEIFYPSRTYGTLIARGRQLGVGGVGGGELDAFSRFIPQGQVNLKRRDALAMLAYMRDQADALKRPKRVSFAFEHTDTWEQAMADLGDRDSPPPKVGDSAPSRLAEELRLRGADLFALIRRGALLRVLAVQETRRQGLGVDRQLMDVTQEAFRRERELVEEDVIRAWLKDNALTEAEFGDFLETESKVRWLETMYGSDSSHYLRDELVAEGLLPAVEARAADKARTLAAQGLADPELGDSGMTADELTRWYFESGLGQPVPANLGRFLSYQGLPDEDSLRREALRELLYRRLAPDRAMTLR
jgi:hypothetical protein